jgi:AcrR family transcriptional regulator
VTPRNSAARREELLDAGVDYVLEHGLAQLSLRPLARALGTSDRMLVYHFQSKDALVAALLLRAVERLGAVLLGRIQPKGRGGDPGSVVQQLWDAMREPDTTPYIRLFFEVYGLSFPDPAAYRPVVQQVVEAWIALVEQLLLQAGVPRRRAPRTAALVVAAIEGLVLAEHALGDDPRLANALRDLKKIARAAGD